jgi:hypothetical protein
MEHMMDKRTPDLQGIRQLYAKSAVARAFLDHVAGRENDQSETKIERILSLLRREGHNFSKTDIRGLFRNLEDLSCGTYIIGRHGHPSRFKWSVGITSLSRVATGESQTIEDVAEKTEILDTIIPDDDEEDNTIDQHSIVEEIGESNGTGLEEEETGGGEIKEPFDPAKIRVEPKVMVISLLLERIKRGEIDLSPAFQRKAGIWKDRQKSQLIESLLIRIPLPAFYMDGGDENRWLVVDGLQRLSTMKSFVLDQSLKLTGMEFLKDYNGKTFDQLPRNLQRRIQETQVTVFLIQENTPPEVKFNIFKRINTGGLPLSSQEIRHALYQGTQGQAADFLRDLVGSSEFKAATNESIKDDRMGAQECVLRLLAFMKTPYHEYKANDLDSFLNARMDGLNKVSKDDLKILSDRFRRAMRDCYRVFGDRAFRKQKRGNPRRLPINRALFEVWGAAIEGLTANEVDSIVERKSALSEAFTTLLEVKDFEDAISFGTGDPKKVRLRFSRVEQLIQETLNDSIDPAD